MRTLIVTSSITFVPENYDQMICSMASHPSVVGLLILENRSISLLIKAFALIITFSAPRLGLTMIKNYFGNSLQRRKSAYKIANKKTWILPDINSTEALELLKNEKIDLIVNSRTRSIFKKQILNQPSLGCINIHHGLLPDQRGLMCDFWAHLEGQDFGFSIHQMTSKIDDGPILHVEKIAGNKNSYMESIWLASQKEAQVTKIILDQISNDGSFKAIINNSSSSILYRKNPSLIDGYRMQRKGVKL
ncbi:MAG: formyltransferase family protein [Bdellovibrionota bacterium]